MRHLIDKTSVDNASAARLHSELGARFSGPLVSFFLRRVKERSQAEDLAQEVLLRVVRTSANHLIEHAEGYVFKVAVNLLRDYRRRMRRTESIGFVPIDEAIAGELESALVEDRSPERVLLSENTLAEALHALWELGELTRNIFILFRLENMKQKDIAALYGIGRSAVEKHVMKAVLHLATRFGRT